MAELHRPGSPVIPAGGGNSVLGLFTVTVQDAARNTVLNAINIVRKTSDPAHGDDGIGVSQTWQAEATSGAVVDLGRVSTYLTDASATLTSEMAFQTRSMGAALANRMRVGNAVLVEPNGTPLLVVDQQQVYIPEPTKAVAAISSWKVRTAAAQLYSTIWCKELQIFVGVGPGTAAWSYDGINWTSVAPANANTWSKVCWSPERRMFVAVGYGANPSNVMTSNDGKFWAGIGGVAGTDWLSIVWAKELSLFVATGHPAGAGLNCVMTSPNGAAWTAHATPEHGDWYGLCWSPELRLLVATCALAAPANGVMTSVDGTNWIMRATPGGSWYDVKWSSSFQRFVAVSSPHAGVPGTRAMTSPDGMVWTGRATPFDGDWYNLSWVPELDLFVTVGRDSATNNPANEIMASVDGGLTWTLYPTPEDRAWNANAYSPDLGIFVAVGFGAPGFAMSSMPVKSIEQTRGGFYFGGEARGASGATSTWYNTADERTNYERLRVYWTGNVATIATETVGATLRDIAFVGGKVGIGQASGTGPSYRLHVVDAGVGIDRVVSVQGTDANSYPGYMVVNNGGEGGGRAVFGIGGSGVPPVDLRNRAYILTYNNTPWMVWNNGATWPNLYCDTQNSRVGVNNIQPNITLEVLYGGTAVTPPAYVVADDVARFTGNGNTNIDINSGVGNVGAVMFSDTVRARGLLQYDHADDSLRMSTAATERMRILSDGKFLVGVSYFSDVSANMELRGGNQTQLEVRSYGATAAQASMLNLVKLRGTQAAAAAVQNGDCLGEVSYSGQFAATDLWRSPGANIAAWTTEAWSNAHFGAELRFSTSLNNTAYPSMRERWIIQNTGHFIPASDGDLNIGDSTHNAQDLYQTGARFRGHTHVNTAISPYAVAAHVRHIIVDTTDVVEIDLPAVATNTNRVIDVSDGTGNASNKNITVKANGAETIVGANTKLIAANWNSLTLYCDGTQWLII